MKCAAIVCILSINCWQDPLPKPSCYIVNSARRAGSHVPAPGPGVRPQVLRGLRLQRGGQRERPGDGARHPGPCGPGRRLPRVPHQGRLRLCHGAQRNREAHQAEVQPLPLSTDPHIAGATWPDTASLRPSTVMEGLETRHADSWLRARESDLACWQVSQSLSSRHLGVERAQGA